MKKLSYISAHCGGNQFIFLRKEDMVHILTNKSISQLYNDLLRLQLKCDQIVVICNANNDMDINVDIYNSDGSQIFVCGNAMLCLGKIVLKTKDNLIIRTERESVQVNRYNNYYSIVMDYEINNVQLMSSKFKLSKLQKELSYKDVVPTFCFLGNQHTCYLTDKYYDTVPISFLKFVEKNPLLQEGTNVEFIKQTGKNHISIKVWERSTGNVSSCATGVAAAWLTYSHKYKVYNETGYITTETSLYKAKIYDNKKIEVYGNPCLVSSGEIALI